MGKFIKKGRYIDHDGQDLGSVETEAAPPPQADPVDPAPEADAPPVPPAVEPEPVPPAVEPAPPRNKPGPKPKQK